MLINREPRLQSMQWSHRLSPNPCACAQCLWTAVADCLILITHLNTLANRITSAIDSLHTSPVPLGHYFTISNALDWSSIEFSSTIFDSKHVVGHYLTAFALFFGAKLINISLFRSQCVKIWVSISKCVQ